MMDRSELNTIYTIGHSAHEFDTFVGLLNQHGIEAVADVRSMPYSRRHPQFNRNVLKSALKPRGISYVFVGKELGGRSADPACYERGRVQYRRLAGTEMFQAGIERVREGARRMKLALMCAEKDPLECHRTILVARELVACGAGVAHVLANGDLETHENTMKRLLVHLNIPEHDLFRNDKELLEEAYSAMERRIAYIDKNLVNEAQRPGE